MQNKILNIPPALVPVSIGNLFNVGGVPGSPVGYTATAPYFIMKHMRVMNIDTVAHVISFYKGATAGSTNGTQFAFANLSIPPQSYFDWVGLERFDAADFLSGVADLAGKVIWNGEGEIGIS